MSLRIYTGLPASGKTSAIITEMEQQKNNGVSVTLILSSEHEELTRRPNVRPQGLMGCRDQTKNFLIDHVVDSGAAADLLAEADPKALIVFDEAQFFQPEIVHDWARAAERGVNVLVGTPSHAQIRELASVDHELIHLTVKCICGAEESTHVVYLNDLVYPTHLCDRCYEEHMNTKVSQLLDTVMQSEPFPGELQTYQPFYDIDMPDWGLVRKDCPARIGIIVDAANRCEAVRNKLDADVEQPSFVDLGCCSGFFADGMATRGFLSSGVDVSQDFIDWAGQLALIKGQAINYQQQDLLEYLTTTERTFDVISTFATVQWVMAQKGYDAGLQCFEKIFEKANSICVIEMGYTSEDIYSDKITDRPVEIDRDWVLKLMNDSGKFKTVEMHPAGENGIWRDIFVGFKTKPTTDRAFDDLPVTNVIQTSNASDYWADNWVGKNLQVSFQATQDYKSIDIEGWRPENADTSTLRFRISGQVVETSHAGPGIFKAKLPISIARNDFFEFGISSTDTFRPEDDARDLAFVLRSLTFN